MLQIKRMEDDRYILIHPNGKSRPLFWITPYPVQSPVIRAFGDDQPVYGLRGPKIDPNSAPLSLDEMAARYIETLRSAQPRGPYAVAGYCIAAVVAREIACRLRAEGEEIDALVMIDPPDPCNSRAPLQQDPLSFKVRAALHRVLFHLRRTREYSLKDTATYYRQSVEQLYQRLREKVTRRIYKKCVDSGKPLPSQLQDNYQSSINAFLISVPQPYSGPVLLLRPAVRPKHGFDYANRRWAQLITGDLEIQEVPGSSDSMWQEANAKELSRRISGYLKRDSRQ